MNFRFLPNCSHAAMGRNQLTADFLNSDADRLFFLDSDVTFETGSIVKVCKRENEVVGGAYRYKLEEENYPVGWLEGKELWANKDGLLEVKTLPGGFLAISRSALEKLKEAHPDRGFEHFGYKMHCFFQMKYENGALYGEDSYFCKEWIDIGGKVFLDPELTLTHWDFNKPYKGHIGNWLKKRAGILLPESA